MEVQTAQRFGGKIQADTKEADKPEPVDAICGKDTKTELGNQRVDKLLCIRLNENSNERHRRPFAYTTACNYLETMESTEKAAVGIAKTWYRKRCGKTYILLWRPLSVDSDENMRGQGNLKRKAVTGGTCKLLRLLHGTSCLEVMLNRRMPNGTYWWCERGDLISPT